MDSQPKIMVYKPMKYFLIAGEASGDIIGAKLIRALKAVDPEAEFIGIGGELMTMEGFKTLLPMSELSVMGIWEVLMRLRQLFKIRDGLVEEIEKYQPDAVITIDFPDFNFQVIKRLKARKKIKTKAIHYVAPTVWAWRPGRAKAISAYLDAIMCLFPFEPDYFKKHKLRSVYVGHPITEDEPNNGNAEEFRKSHGIDPDVKLLGLFFGSRQGELKMNAEVIKAAATYVSEQFDKLHLIVPTTKALEFDVMQLVHDIGIPAYVESDYSKKWDAFAACDAGIAVSGTVALELAYAGTPHVVVYKTHPLTYLIVRLLARVKYVHLGNIIVNKPIVKEFIQFRCIPELVSEHVLKLMNDNDERTKQIEGFEEIRTALRSTGGEDPSSRAARFIQAVVKSGNNKQGKKPQEQALDSIDNPKTTADNPDVVKAEEALPESSAA